MIVNWGRRPATQELVRNGRIVGFAGSNGNKSRHTTNGSFDGKVLPADELVVERVSDSEDGGDAIGTRISRGMIEVGAFVEGALVELLALKVLEREGGALGGAQVQVGEAAGSGGHAVPETKGVGAGDPFSVGNEEGALLGGRAGSQGQSLGEDGEGIAAAEGGGETVPAINLILHPTALLVSHVGVRAQIEGALRRSPGEGVLEEHEYEGNGHQVRNPHKIGRAHV